MLSKYRLTDNWLTQAAEETWFLGHIYVYSSWDFLQELMLMLYILVGCNDNKHKV